MKLEGRVALVTGGNRGIGEAIVRLFSAEGAKVVFCARRAELGKAVEDDVRQAGGEVTFIACDVTDEEAVRKLVDRTVDLYGGLNTVVSCAGIAPAVPVEKMDLSDWDEILRINVTSMFLVSKHSIPRLREAEGASIITLGSTFGTVGAPGSAAYGVTKASAINFAKSLAIELAPDGIRVNALCPGGTDTEFLQEWFEDLGDAAAARTWLTDRHPIGRLARPEEPARAALFLASDDASFVTGHSMLVDGGYTAQ
jgi:NAD(P)-dependent dehydrogenase (short-subunit alcohol dehydrogenase family)